VSSIWLAIGLAPWAAQAQSGDIFMCVDDQGNKSFQNVGTAKGCKRMDVGPVLSPVFILPFVGLAGPLYAFALLGEER